ncbi:DUF4255 domain-containing protein [Thermosulfuriphilus sp.]
MSTVISAVSRSLIEILKEGLKDLIPNPNEGIVLSSPGDLGPSHTPRLCLFLYEVRENAYLKNRDPEGLRGRQRPCLALDLYYMLTTYAPSQMVDRTEATLEEYRILGQAMRILQEHSLLTDPYLRGSLMGSGLQLRVLFNPIPIEEMARIWNAFHTRPFKLSVCYLVTPVIIETDEESLAPTREIKVCLEAK